MGSVRVRLLLRAVLPALLLLGAAPLAMPSPAGAVAPTVAPSGLTPDGENVGSNPQLSWDRLPDAPKYRVQVSADAAFASLIVNELTYNSTYTPTAELPTGTVYWRVAGTDAGGSSGPNATASFTKGLPAPVAQAPADGATVSFPADAPTFSWTATPGSKSYRLEVDDAADFNGAQAYTSVNTSFTLTEAQPSGQSYWWRVRGASGTGGTGGVVTDWSPARSYTVAWPSTPNLVTPASGQALTDAELSWDAVPGAAAYNVQIDLDSEFVAPLVATANGVHGTRYSPPSALDNQSYWWRVQAVDAKANLGSWSAPRPFTKQWLSQPTQQVPVAETATSGNLQFQWTPIDHASSYELQFSNDQFFSTNVDACSTTETRIFVTNDLCELNSTNEAIAYYWRVRGIDSPRGITSLWSTTRRQTGHTPLAVAPGAFDPLTPVTRLTPSDCGDTACALRATPTFTWQAVPGANQYRFYLASDPNFTTIIRTYVLANQTAFTPNVELSDNNAGQAYYWHVRPCVSTPTSCGPDPNGASPSYSTFKKSSAQAVPTQPANGLATEVANAPTFRWQPYLETTKALPDDPAPGTTDLEARQYELQVSTLNSFASLVDDKTIDQPFFTPYDRTYPEGPLYWRVRATDGSGNFLTWSEPQTFTKKSPAPTIVTPANGATVAGAPSFRWQPLPFSASYEYEIYKNGDTLFSPANRVLVQSTQHVRHTPALALPTGEYTWRVRRRDADNRVGAWSSDSGTVPKFTIQTATVQLASPANGAVVGEDLVLAWDLVQGAVTYRVQRANNSAFTSPTNRDTVMTSYAPTEQIAVGTWYWRVVALDAGGNPMGQSASRTFLRDATPGAPTGVTATAANGSATVSWTAPAANGSSAITGYVITPYIGGTAQSARVASASARSLVVTGLTNGTAYTFKVAAQNAAGIGVQSSASPSVTPQAPPAGPEGSVYVAMTPCRVADTRTGGGALTPGEQRQLQISGSGSAFNQQGGVADGCGIPGDAVAVEASVTATNPSASGFFRAWPSGVAAPNATFINFTKARSATNTGAITLSTSQAKDLTVRNFGATVHYVIDVQGYFRYPPTTGGTVFVAVTPCRVLDTRNGGGGILGPSAQRSYRVGGTGSQFAAQGGTSVGCGIPETALAVEASVTAVNPVGNGFFRAWPSGVTAPNATFINYSGGQSTTNTGAITLANSQVEDLTVKNFSGSSHYVIDVQGYYATPADAPTGAEYVPISPCRIVDTRVAGAGGPLAPDQQRSFNVGGSSFGFDFQGGTSGGCGIPLGSKAVEASVTAVTPGSGGFFRLWPSNVAPPNATFLNFVATQSTTNTGAVALSPSVPELRVGHFSPASSHYVIDIQGYFSTTS